MVLELLWRANGRPKLLCCDEGRVERIEFDGKHLYLTKEGELSLLKTCKAAPHNQDGVNACNSPGFRKTRSCSLSRYV